MSMKIEVDPSLMSMSGRWTKRDSTVTAHSKKTGKHWQYIMRTDVKQPNSEAQQAVKALFTQKAAAIAKWWNENKPSSTNQNGTEDFQHLMRNYDAQAKYGNKFCYARSLVDDDLKLHIGTTVIDLSSDDDEPGGGGGSGSGSGALS